MGVKGLDSWCREHGVGTSVAFSPEAPRTLLCDLSNLMHWLARRATPRAEVAVLGGQYEQLAEATAALVDKLAAAGITLCCFADPSRGTDAGGKHSEWVARFEERLRDSAGLERWCAGLGAAGLRADLPELAMEQVSASLVARGVDVLVTASEADGALVDACHAVGGYAVLSQDSDFAVITVPPGPGLGSAACAQGSVYIPISSLELEEDQVSGTLISPQELAAALELPLPMLPALAALCGNDLTKHAVQAVHSELGLPPSSSAAVTAVADWLRAIEEPLEASERWQQLLEAHPEFERAVQESDQFYSRTLAPPAPAETELEQLIRAEMCSQSLPRFSLAVHCNHQFWGSSRLASEPGSDAVTRPLRAVCYGLLGAASVTEYVRDWDDSEAVTTVTVAASGSLDLLQARRCPVESRTALLCTASGTLWDHIATVPAPLKCTVLALRFLLTSRDVSMTTKELSDLCRMAAVLSGQESTPATLIGDSELPGPPRLRLLEVQLWFQAALKQIRSIVQLLRLEGHVPLLEPQKLYNGLLLQRLDANSQLLLPEPAEESLRLILPILRPFATAGPLVTPAPTPLIAALSPMPVPEQPVPVDLADAKLPIEENRDQIIEHVRSHRVTIISGETGCGKSSRLPLFLYQNSLETGGRVAKMFVAQPRRIAAHGLLKYTRDGLGMGPVMGMRMGGHVRDESSATRIWFVTTGYLVRLLAHHPEEFASHSHLIIDEVHERSIDSDVLCYLVRRLLDTYSHIRVILMSATLHVKLYADYFESFSPGNGLFVGARRFPVQIIYTEELPETFENAGRFFQRAVAQCQSCCEQVGAGKDALSKLSSMQHDLVLLITQCLENQMHGGSAVLVFVPGMEDIMELFERFGQLESAQMYKCIAIHSDIPFEEQLEAWEPPAAGEVKVIIATNAAESSVTLPDVDIVICLGTHKQVQYDHLNDKACLKKAMISKASATQRAGRTGRVRPGTVFRLYSRRLYDAQPEHETSEIHRQPLGTTLLRLKVMLEGPVATMLSELLEPPDERHVDRAFESLFSAGMITEPSDEGQPTKIGTVAATLPIDLHLTRMLCFAVRLECLPDAVVMAAAMTQPRMPFRIASPLFHTDPDDYHSIISRHVTGRARLDSGFYSEPLMMLRLYCAWIEMKQTSVHFRVRSSWCDRHGLLKSRLEDFEKTVAGLQRQIGTALCNGNKVPDPTGFNSPSSSRLAVLRCMLLWANPGHLLKATAPKSHRKSELPDRTAELSPIDAAKPGVNESQLRALMPSCVSWCVSVPRVVESLVSVKPRLKDWKHAIMLVEGLVREIEPEVAALLYFRKGSEGQLAVFIKHSVESIDAVVEQLGLGKAQREQQMFRGQPWCALQLQCGYMKEVHKKMLGCSWSLAALVLNSSESSAKLDFVSEQHNLVQQVKPMLQKEFGTSWNHRGGSKDKPRTVHIQFEHSEPEQIATCSASALVADQPLGARLLLAAAHGRRRRREKGRPALVLLLPPSSEAGAAGEADWPCEENCLEAKLAVRMGFDWQGWHNNERKKAKFSAIVKDECSLMKVAIDTTSCRNGVYAVYNTGLQMNEGMVLVEQLTVLPGPDWAAVALLCVGYEAPEWLECSLDMACYEAAEEICDKLRATEEFRADRKLREELDALLMQCCDSTPHDQEALQQSWEDLLPDVYQNPRLQHNEGGNAVPMPSHGASKQPSRSNGAPPQRSAVGMKLFWPLVNQLMDFLNAKRGRATEAQCKKELLKKQSAKNHALLERIGGLEALCSQLPQSFSFDHRSRVISLPIANASRKPTAVARSTAHQKSVALVARDAPARVARVAQSRKKHQETSQSIIFNAAAPPFRPGADSSSQLAPQPDIPVPKSSQSAAGKSLTKQPDAKAKQSAASVREVRDWMVELLHSGNCKMDNSVLCTELYTRHPTARLTLKQQGGVQGLCKLFSSELTFQPAKKGSGTVVLAHHTNSSSVGPAVKAKDKAGKKKQKVKQQSLPLPTAEPTTSQEQDSKTDPDQKPKSKKKKKKKKPLISTDTLLGPSEVNDARQDAAESKRQLNSVAIPLPAPAAPHPVPQRQVNTSNKESKQECRNSSTQDQETQSGKRTSAKRREQRKRQKERQKNGAAAAPEDRLEEVQTQIKEAVGSGEYRKAAELKKERVEIEDSLRK